MFPLHEAEGEANDSDEMTKARSEWQRCGIKKLGEEEDHASTRLSWSWGKGFPIGCISGPLNILVLWEKRQGRGLASVEGRPSSLLEHFATQEALLC